MNLKKYSAIAVLVLMFGGIAFAGLETVTHIQDLNASWPLGSDLASTSDDHIRNIKSALKTDFPNFNGTYTSAALPVFAIPSDTNTGMYSVGADDLGFSTGGTLRFDISTSAFTATLPWRGQDGAVGAPAISFSADTDTGIYRSGANTLVIAAGGAGAAVFTSSTNSSSHEFGLQDGNATLPGLFFANDTNTGVYRAASDTIVIAAGGANAAVFTSSTNSSSHELGIQDGNASLPGLFFANDTDTGFYRDTANQIGIALAGSTAGQIAKGTYTGTLTGLTTSPTTTVEYIRVGNLITIFIPTASGTSNSTAFTITGAPSVIQAASGTGRFMCGPLTNSGADLTDIQGEFTAASGTLTFYRAGSASGFTASGTKGIPATGTQCSYMTR